MFCDSLLNAQLLYIYYFKTLIKMFEKESKLKELSERGIFESKKKVFENSSYMRSGGGGS